MTLAGAGASAPPVPAAVLGVTTSSRGPDDVPAGAPLPDVGVADVPAPICGELELVPPLPNEGTALVPDVESGFRLRRGGCSQPVAAVERKQIAKQSACRPAVSRRHIER